MLLNIAVIIPAVVLFFVALSLFGRLRRKRAVRLFKIRLAALRSESEIAATHSANRAKTDPKKESSLKG